MMISSRGRYALRVMIDLAEESNGEFVPLKTIADRLSLSHKYVESIMTTLSKANLLEGVHGKGGGYRLLKKPEEYSVGEILRLTEKSLSPVSCLDGECEQAGECRTFPLWEKLGAMITEYLDSVSIADLMSKE